MRVASMIVVALVVVGASIAACAEGDSPGFENVGGGGGGDGDGDGGDGDGGDSTNTSGQATGPTTTGSGSTGVTTSTGTTSTGTATTTSTSTGTGGAPPCQDQGPGEPGNDQMATAWYLGEIGDGDGDGGTVAGNLRQEGDVDWYSYLGTDGFGSVVDPTRQLIGAGIRICKYLDCVDEAPEEFDCPSGTQPDTQGGHPGCCWSGGEEVAIDAFNCNGPISDDATVYIRIDHVGGPECEAYTLNYHY